MRYLQTIFSSKEWFGFVLAGYVILFVDSFMLAFYSHLSADISGAIYKVLLYGFMTIAVIDLIVRCVFWIIQVSKKD